MAFVPLYGTGLETGSSEQIPAVDKNQAYVIGAAHSGAYGLHLDSNYPSTYGWARWPVDSTPADLYFSAWAHPDGDFPLYIEFYVDSGHYVGIRHDGSYWDAYVNGSKVADGSIAHTKSTWHLVELHVIISDTGTIETRIDAVEDVSYSGDTKPGATTAITYVRAYQYVTGISENADSYLDDMVFGTGGWAGDVRFNAALVPSSDTAQIDWTPSTGTDNYALVDEVPPSDTDYVSSLTMGNIDMYELGDWTPPGTDYDILFINDWMRASTDTPGAKVKSVITSGSTTSNGDAESLTTTPTYYHRMLAADPNTASAWEAAAINALKIGQERA